MNRPDDSRVESHWSAFDAAGIQRLVAAEDRHFWFRARNETIAALARRPIENLSDGFRILEVGCGSGNVLRVLQRLAAGRGTVEGLEVSREAAAVARSRTGLTVTDGYLSDLDPDLAFDVIAAFDVLEHIADESGVLGEIRERLRPGGCLILTVPAHQKSLERVRRGVGARAALHAGDALASASDCRLPRAIRHVLHERALPDDVGAPPPREGQAT